MLVLTFRRDEDAVVEIGGDVLKVKYLWSKGGKVKLGFDGPQSVRVHRAKVLEDKQRQALVAADAA